MNITIPSNATLQSINAAFPAPRGATHFRFTAQGRKPVIDAIKNLDTLTGCSGKLEYGKVQFEGRGRHAKIKAFTALGVASASVPEGEPAPEPVARETESMPAASKARKNKVLGFSACAVAKALGAAGVKYEDAARILRAHGIEMPKASLSVQLGFGRNSKSWERHGNPAPLTAEQMSELRAQAAQ